MTDNTFEHLIDLPKSLKRALQIFKKLPTERNHCYIVGYLSALHDTGQLRRDTYSNLFTLVGTIRYEADKNAMSSSKDPK